MNIVIEIHVLPRQNLELAILLPNRQRLTSVERLIHSDRYEDPTPSLEQIEMIEVFLFGIVL
uniref:Uncharacterized protein n=1 Tax=Aegilops tauschii subsp. strangulata TaxID=200361 RepID=A0A453CLK0_AEGTS